MTPREKMILALEGKQPPGRVPHFELVFYLTMEAFGRVHPSHRVFGQWDQMSPRERELHRRDVADLYVQTAKRYEHSAIFFHSPSGWKLEDTLESLAHIREISGQDYLLMVEGDATYSMPNGNNMMEFSARLVEEPQQLKDEAQRKVDTAIARAQTIRQHGVLDAFAMCCDYCFNNNPFLSPAMFDEFVTPYLTQLCQAYRRMGYYTIKHTDGNIMPILDSLVSAGPHALHSLDPQGGVDMAQMKRRCGKKLCLIGNVCCGTLDTGSEEQVVEATRYALKNGMPGGGYVFSSSNCVYTGMDLKRYDLMLDVWRKEGNYPDQV